MMPTFIWRWVVAFLLVLPIHCVQFDVPTTINKCISEEYSGGILVKGRYASPQQTDVTLEVSVSKMDNECSHSTLA